MKMGIRHTPSFSVVVTIPIGCGGFWWLEGRVAVSLKGLVKVGPGFLVQCLFGFPKGRITNKTIFPIDIARPSTTCGRFL